MVRRRCSHSKMHDAGAVAVITETDRMEEPLGFISASTIMTTSCSNLSHGKRTLSEWEGEVERVRKDTCHLILQHLAQARRRSPISPKGQSVSAPTRFSLTLRAYGFNDRGHHLQPEKLYEFVHAAASAVSIPVMTRLPYNLACAPHLHAVERADCAICAIESLRRFPVPISRRKQPLRRPICGYTGRQIYFSASTARLHN